MKNRRARFSARLGRVVQLVRLERWTAVAAAAGFLLAFAVVVVATQLPTLTARGARGSWQAGAVAEADYVIARDFQFVDEPATKQKRDAQERLVPPVFVLNAGVTANILDGFDRFSQALERLDKEGLAEDAVLARLRIDFPDNASRPLVRALLGSHDLAKALADARAILEGVLAGGVVDLSAHRDEAVTAGAIELRRTVDGRLQTEEVPLEAVTSMTNAAALAETRALQNPYGEQERRVVLAAVRAFTGENTFYDGQATDLRRARARAAVQPVTEKLARGQVLVRRGDVVSGPLAERISALGAYSKSLDANAIVGGGLFLLMTFVLALYLLNMKGPNGPLRRGNALLVIGMGLGHVVVSALVVRFATLPEWMPVSVALPTGAMAMLVAILVSTPVGVFFSLAVSLSLLLVSSMSVQVFLFSFLGGVAATAVVLNAERRIDLVRAGLLLAAADALILVVIGLLGNYTPRMILSLVGWGTANGFLCAILTLGFLPILEMVLNAPTRFKLMELSDLNSAIFKKMLSQAPGTYTHSISVANLAETASEAIGANALLARVSAYYHDIGKVDQADYFVENQKAHNRHDELRPSLSVAVIKSHVRIGIEKARELKLPQAIIDIIAQHHGRGLITYFYHRAVKEGKNPRVSRDDYSYPGVRPRSKEAAVLMLADSVEAASRTLKRPTEARLDVFVQSLIMEKFSSGELGDSSLTLRDLELIRKSFVHILEGYFHTRIEYPRIAQIGAPAQKPAATAHDDHGAASPHHAADGHGTVHRPAAGHGARGRKSSTGGRP
jgi:cyclic-di-AMP phosphodiesterase PgpH